MKVLDFNSIDFKQPPTDLCMYMERNKSDKSTRHNYTLVYDFLFKKLRNKKINLFECGLGSKNTSLPCNMGSDARPGSSLFAWSEYFLKGTILGCDIDDTIKLDEFKTFVCDQTNPASIQNMWSNINLDFDIIIDDGYHNFEANCCFFENSFHKLKKDGIYIIEDIYINHCLNFKKYFKQHNIKHNYVMQLPYRPDCLDNCLAIIIKDF